MVQTQEYDIIMPQYYDEFACIGPACEDDCCYGWNIVLDKKTYTKYRNVKSPVFTEKQERYIKRIKGKSANDLNYAKFEMNEDGKCPFQAEDKLCQIHRDLGEEYLCRTCRVYPRLFKAITDEYNELSLSMSCPVAARIALFNEDGIEFIAHSRPIRNNDPLISGRDMPKPGKPGTATESAQYLQYGWEMRQAAITVMQIRDCPIAYRVIIIAMMLEEAVRLHDEGRHADIPETLEYYSGGTYGEQFVAGFDGIEPNDDLQMKISLLLYTAFKDVLSQPRSRSLAKLLGRVKEYYALDNQDPESVEAATAAGYHMFITQAAQAHWEDFLKQRGYVLENYLVSYMFSELFPLKLHEHGLDPYHHAFLLAEQYLMLKMLLCGNYDEKEGWSDDYLVSTITEIAVTNQHTTNPLKTVLSYKKIGIDTPAHLYYFLF